MPEPERSRRAFVVVIDACGAGALPDAADHGDAGANTLGHLATKVGGLRLPTLERLGLGCILALHGVPPAGRSHLQELHDADVPVHGVGKVGQLFAGVGFDAGHPGPTNAQALTQTTQLTRALERTAAHTDHAREHAPLLALLAGHGSRRHDGPLADVGAGALHRLTGRSAPDLPGRSFISGGAGA